jgi:hypothetical protein
MSKLFNLLLEASKIDVLTKKVGLSVETAEKLFKMFKNRSVFMANKILDLKKVKNSSYYYTENEHFIEPIINRGTIRNGFETIRLNEIEDYMVIALDGDISSLKDKNLIEISKLSKEWHDSLGEGEGKINYKEEEEDIFIDYRDENGIGFYWVDLKTNNCDEESKRMGHCGRDSSAQTLYSLRQYKQIGKEYRINTSHVTVAIANNDVATQIKGGGNIKPKSEYHKYIVDLFLNEYVLGTDYYGSGEGDFKFSDIEDDSLLKKLYSEKPDLFRNYSSKYALYNKGIITDFEPITEITFETVTKDIGELIEVGGNFRDDILEVVFGEDYTPEKFWDSYSQELKHSEGIFDYYTNKENDALIETILEKIILNESEDFDIPEDLDDMSLFDKLSELEDQSTTIDELINKILSVYSHCEADAYWSYLKGTAIQTLKENFKEVIIDNEKGIITTTIDLTQFNESDVIDAVEYAEDYIYTRKNSSLDIMIYEYLTEQGVIEKLTVYYDDRYTPNVSTKYFNEYLKEELESFDAETYPND